MCRTESYDPYDVIGGAIHKLMYHYEGFGHIALDLPFLSRVTRPQSSGHLRRAGYYLAGFPSRPFSNSCVSGKEVTEGDVILFWRREGHSFFPTHIKGDERSVTFPLHLSSFLPHFSSSAHTLPPLLSSPSHLPLVPQTPRVALPYSTVGSVGTHCAC